MTISHLFQSSQFEEQHLLIDPLQGDPLGNMVFDQDAYELVILREEELFEDYQEMKSGNDENVGDVAPSCCRAFKNMQVKTCVDH